MEDLLPVLALLFGIWWLWRYVTRPTLPRTPAQAAPTEILPCAHCGTYVPRTDAVQHGGKIYCCSEHSVQKSRRA